MLIFKTISNLDKMLLSSLKTNPEILKLSKMSLIKLFKKLQKLILPV